MNPRIIHQERVASWSWQHIFFFRSWKMALKQFAFKEASLLILGMFSGVTPVHGKTAFKDIKPSPRTYQTWSMINNSWQHHSPKSFGRFFSYPVEDDRLSKDQKELFTKSSQPGWLSHCVQDSCTIKTSPPWLRGDKLRHMFSKVLEGLHLISLAC